MILLRGADAFGNDDEEDGPGQLGSSREKCDGSMCAELQTVCEEQFGPALVIFRFMESFFMNLSEPLNQRLREFALRFRDFAGRAQAVLLGETAPVMETGPAKKHTHL